MKNKRGFTLIEVIIYIALFSLLLGTAFVTAFQLIDGSGKLNIKAVTQEEGNFVMRKFNWAMMGVNPAIVTTPSLLLVNSPTLKVKKYDGVQINICLDSDKIKIRKDGITGACSDPEYLPLTTDNVKVSSLDFKYETLGGITMTTIINGKTFTFTKYFRK